MDEDISLEQLQSEFDNAQSWMELNSESYEQLSFPQLRQRLYRVDANLSDEMADYDPQAFGLGVLKNAAVAIFNFIRKCLTWIWNQVMRVLSAFKNFFSSKVDTAKDSSKNKQNEAKIAMLVNQPPTTVSNTMGQASPENPIPVANNPTQDWYIETIKRFSTTYAHFSGGSQPDHSSVTTVEQANELFYATANLFGQNACMLSHWRNANDPAFNLQMFQQRDPHLVVSGALISLMDIPLHLVKGLKTYIPQYGQYQHAMFDAALKKLVYPHWNDAVSDEMLTEIARFRRLTTIVADRDDIPKLLVECVQHERDKFMLDPQPYTPLRVVPVDTLLKDPDILRKLSDAKLALNVSTEGLKQCAQMQTQQVDKLNKDYGSVESQFPNGLPFALRSLLNQYSQLTTSVVKLTEFTSFTMGRLIRLSVVYHDYTNELQEISDILDEYMQARQAMEA